MYCEQCGKPIGIDTAHETVIKSDGKKIIFCALEDGTDCLRMYYYEEELERHERNKLVW
jgi:hypothetical protein